MPGMGVAMTAMPVRMLVNLRQFLFAAA